MIVLQREWERWTHTHTYTHTHIYKCMKRERNKKLEKKLKITNDLILREERERRQEE
jgi:hypothetical protein